MKENLTGCRPQIGQILKLHGWKDTLSNSKDLYTSIAEYIFYFLDLDHHAENYLVNGSVTHADILWKVRVAMQDIFQSLTKFGALSNISHPPPLSFLKSLDWFLKICFSRLQKVDLTQLEPYFAKVSIYIH